MKKFILLLSLFSLIVSCADDDMEDGIYCTEEARSALVVTVKNAETGFPITEGITVIASDEGFSEVLTNVFWESGEYSGVFERQGNYTITVTGEGYQEYTSDIVTVDADRCHVITKNVIVNLQPL